MTEPVDAIRAFHNAFRVDIKQIDAAALSAARGEEGLANAIGRYRFLNEILVWHAKGEELAVFPAIEQVAPLVAEPYERDHRWLDTAFSELDASYAARDTIRTARAAAAFRFHLDIHLAKEDTHLYRIFRERVNPPEQAAALGIMSGTVPKERFPEVVAWMFPLIGDNDRENMTRIWQKVMPEPVFTGIKGLIKTTLGSEWDGLARRIPGL
jgi:hypothetical protein